MGIRERPRIETSNEGVEEIIYPATGILHYSRGEHGGYRLVLNVDQQISEYYRSLIPKYISINKQRYNAHISVVRKETPIHLDFWGKYDGQEVEYFYSPIVHFGKVYCWLNVFSQRLEEIRLELGLPVSSEYTLPPEGFVKCFHMTLGNMKPLV